MNKRFFWRAFVSLGLFLSFLMIVFSGILLYIAPPGRIARWLDWTVLGLDRAQWEAQHTIFSYLFIAFALWHLLRLNWKAFISYLRNRLRQKFRYRKELWAAFIMFAIVFFFTLLKTPPVYTIMDLGGKASDFWAREKGKPPIPHAEELTVRVFALELLDAAPEEVLEVIRSSGFEAESTEIALEDIAARNGVSPAVLFDSLKIHFSVKEIPGISDDSP